jgi:hypothetical protein
MQLLNWQKAPKAVLVLICLLLMLLVWIAPSSFIKVVLSVFITAWLIETIRAFNSLNNPT